MDSRYVCLWRVVGREEAVKAQVNTACWSRNVAVQMRRYECRWRIVRITKKRKGQGERGCVVEAIRITPNHSEPIWKGVIQTRRDSVHTHLLCKNLETEEEEEALRSSFSGNVVFYSKDGWSKSSKKAIKIPRNKLDSFDKIIEKDEKEFLSLWVSIVVQTRGTEVSGPTGRHRRKAG